MGDYRFELEQYQVGGKNRYTCPGCRKAREFTRYIDSETKQYVSREVGMCNRRDHCGYHYSPRQYFENKGETMPNSQLKALAPKASEKPKEPSHYHMDLVKRTLSHYERNGFIQFLLQRYGQEVITALLKRHRIGTTKDGRTIFWLIDSQGHVRNGQIIPYNSVTGKRRKDVIPAVTWVHAKRPLPNVVNCLFGEQLLMEEGTKPVAIVEAPKTAVIASLYFPQYVWLATCGKHGFRRISPDGLLGRDVYLFPDLGYDSSARKTTLEIWREQAGLLRQKCINAQVVDLLEKVATPYEKRKGLDLADYLLQLDLVM